MSKSDLNLASPNGININAFSGDNLNVAVQIVNLRDSLPAARFNGPENFKTEAANSISGWNTTLQDEVLNHFFVSERFPGN